MSVFVKMTKESYDKAMQTISDQSSRIAILREALERIGDRQARMILPWTHEAAADEYAAMLDMDRTEAREALLRAQNN